MLWPPNLPLKFFKSIYNNSYSQIAILETIIEDIDSGNLEDARYMLRLKQDGSILGLNNSLEDSTNHPSSDDLKFLYDYLIAFPANQISRLNARRCKHNPHADCKISCKTSVDLTRVTFPVLPVRKSRQRLIPFWNKQPRVKNSRANLFHWFFVSLFNATVLNANSFLTALVPAGNISV